MNKEQLQLFPIKTDINKLDHLSIGGCDTSELVNEFGTPLYIYDEFTLTEMCKTFSKEFKSRYPNTEIVYASKAFSNLSIFKILEHEGLGLDVVSGGELALAESINFPNEKIYFHGNNKTRKELKQALIYQVGKIVVDNFYELNLLNELAKDLKITQDITLRLSPGIDPHTHTYTTTGTLDSKFGFSLETGDAAKAFESANRMSNLQLTGIHFHLGSPIFELEPYAVAIDKVLEFISKLELDNQKQNLLEFSPGGGFAIGYIENELPPPISSYADTITKALKDGCSKYGLDQPKLVIEPGRSIIGRSGIALYKTGSIKVIPNIRKYVSVDGGMGDNIRPALYDSKYHAVVANRMSETRKDMITIAGKFCESGDILVKDINMPIINPEDIIAIPASGAYNSAMSSNYNMNPRPPILLVNEGKAKLIRRGETYKDLIQYDIV